MKRSCKKIFSILLALVMLISLMPTIMLTATAGDEAVITVGTQTAVAGGEVTVPVMIADNPGFSSFVLTPTYDTGNLTLTAVEKGSAITSTSGSLSYNTNIIYGDSVNTTGNGTILNLIFAVNASAAAGDYSITLAVAESDSENFCNAAFEAVPVSFTDGGITVTVPDTTPPAMESLTATVGGVTTTSTDGTFSATVGDEVTSIKVAMSEPVSLVDGASAEVKMSGGTLPDEAVYGTVSLDESDATNKTLIVEPSENNATAGQAGTFTFTLAAGTLKDLSDNENETITFELTVAADETPPTMESLTATVGGVTTTSMDGEFKAIIGDTVTSIKVTMSEPVSLVDGASTEVKMSGGTLADEAVYGAVSLDESDATNKTLIVEPSENNATAGQAGTFTFTLAAEGPAGLFG